MLKEFAKFFLDIAKYLITVILIGTFFSSFESLWPVFLCGILLTMALVGVSVLFFLRDKKENPDRN